MLTGAGRQSLAAAVERLTAAAETVGADALVELAGEVASFGLLLRGQPRLRRALADPGRAPAARVGLLRDLVGQRLGALTADLLATLVGGRWSGHAQLLDATERLGVGALLLAADREGRLADVEDELFRFSQIVAGDIALEAALGDHTAPVAHRAELARSLLEGKADPVTVRLVTLALDGLGGRGFTASLSWLVEEAAEQRSASVAYVTVAVPLADAEERRLAELLTQRYGRAVSLKVVVDPGVVGGVRVQVGSDLFDGTVRRRLADARTVLTS